MAEIKITIERRDRPTIMDGKVSTFATGFSEEEGLLGPRWEATGPFEISVSRNKVSVHRAELFSREDHVNFIEGLRDAWDACEEMRHGQ